MCFNRKKRKQQKIDNQKEMARLYTPDEQKIEAEKLLGLCQAHLNSMVRTAELYLREGTEDVIREDQLEKFREIKAYYASGKAAEDMEHLRYRIINIANFGEFMDVFNEAVKLGSMAVNQMGYCVEAIKPKSQR